MENESLSVAKAAVDLSQKLLTIIQRQQRDIRHYKNLAETERRRAQDLEKELCDQLCEELTKGLNN